MNRFDHDDLDRHQPERPAAARRDRAGVAALRPVAGRRRRNGRRFLYDAPHTSGHGDTACASCHIFGDFDSLAWDLGDPFGVGRPEPEPVRAGPARARPFHPMKGPMTTQSLRGMAGAGPMHWRGDRTGGSDPGGDPLDEDARLQGSSTRPSSACSARRRADARGAMQAFTDFILTVRYPPNPIRALDNMPHAPRKQAGQDFFTDRAVRRPRARATSATRLPLGTDGLSSIEGEPQEFKIAHLRNAYQKVGMFGLPPGPGNPGVVSATRCAASASCTTAASPPSSTSSTHRASTSARDPNTNRGTSSSSSCASTPGSRPSSASR